MLFLLVLRFFNNTHCRSEKLNSENESVVLDLINWYNLLEWGSSLIGVALVYETKRKSTVRLRVIVDMTYRRIGKNGTSCVENLRKQDIYLDKRELTRMLRLGQIVTRRAHLYNQIQLFFKGAELLGVEMHFQDDMLETSCSDNVQDKTLKRPHAFLSQFVSCYLQNVNAFLF